MSEYIALKDYAKHLEIHQGDIIFISSDAKRMLWDAASRRKNADLNKFIDGLVAAVGSEGTIIFPTYNWGFCQGITFDYLHTPCKTGTLGAIALTRKDFRRTLHPIYSFAVFGKYQEQLCAMKNEDSFGLDSPFAFFKNYNVINFVIDVTLEHCFTFAHFAEQQSGDVHYRFEKNFTAGYIDVAGKETERTYSMFVRKLELDVQTTIDPIEEDFLSSGAEKKYTINSSSIKRIQLGKAYEILIRDIRENWSRKLCRYIGQNK